MKYKYELDESLKSLYKIRTPFSKVLFPPANLFLRLFTLRSGSGIVVKRYTISGLPVLDAAPEGAPDDIPVIIYLHGGAFVYSSAPYHYKLMREYALSGCRVLMPDYSLSPKKRYPSAVLETAALYSWAKENLSTVVALGGDSAGGEIVLSSTLRILEEGMEAPQFLMLIYPVVAPVETKSKRNFTDTPVWSSLLNEKMWRLYLGEEEYRSVLESPLLSIFPPSYVETPLLDALHDEGVMLVEKLRKNGVAVTHRDIPSAPHGYDMALSSPVVKESIEERKRFIMSCFC